MRKYISVEGTIATPEKIKQALEHNRQALLEHEILRDRLREMADEEERSALQCADRIAVLLERMRLLETK